jgi:hypothetical protein
MHKLECEYGTPAKYFKKIRVKAGDTAHKGEVISIEGPTNLTDDQVNSICNKWKDEVCKTEEGIHVRYFYLSNTKQIIQEDMLEDWTFSSLEVSLVESVGAAIYRLLTLPQTIMYYLYKARYPLIFGVGAVIGYSIPVIMRRKTA